MRAESGNTFIKTTLILVTIGLLSVYGIHLCQQKINEIYAENIITGVWERAQQEKERVDPLNPEDADAAYPASSRLERKGYGFTIADVSTPTLIKVETEKKMITPSVCRMLKKKLKSITWRDVFIKVLVIDRMGDEKTDILIYNCPQEKIPALRFYAKFAPNIVPEEETTEAEVKTEAKPVVESASAPAPAPMPVSRSPRPSTSYSRPTCPAGTSENGSGGIATAGCRCNGSGESWNGSSCVTKSCPAGSSRKTSGTGNWTNVSGCRCNDETPVWENGHCTKKCLGDKIFDLSQNQCVCPHNTHPKKGSNDLCVECNDSSECMQGFSCINNRCSNGQEEYDDCRWGICQTCDEQQKRYNLPDDQSCEVAGLAGQCNGNGTCYPVEGRG